MSRQRQRKPSHPGIVFKHDVLEPLGLSVSRAAEALGISRKHLSAFVNGRVPCSRELAQRVAKATDTSVASWLNMQTALDVWEAEQNPDEELAKVRLLTSLETQSRQGQAEGQHR
ncbi:HigA family addiction module antitoxin [Halomonas sp. NO4]|uniref:HigA family addiction module antitoxin n=1 Tax=Halomonas sp. NO4 TaxID=2484813 RepID=UPI0013D102C3|nr:HigA family addiction module antitoxin [Halomonas sp. NO4]